MDSTAQLISLLQEAFTEMQENGSSWTQEIFNFTPNRKAAKKNLKVSEAFISSTYRHWFAEGKVLSQVEEEPPRSHPLVIVTKKTKKSNRVGFADQVLASTPQRPHLEGTYNKQKRQRTSSSDVEREDTASALLSLSSFSSLTS